MATPDTTSNGTAKPLSKGYAVERFELPAWLQSFGSSRFAPVVFNFLGPSALAERAGQIVRPFTKVPRDGKFGYSNYLDMYGGAAPALLSAMDIYNSSDMDPDTPGVQPNLGALLRSPDLMRVSSKINRFMPSDRVKYMRDQVRKASENYSKTHSVEGPAYSQWATENKLNPLDTSTHSKWVASPERAQFMRELVYSNYPEYTAVPRLRTIGAIENLKKDQVLTNWNVKLADMLDVVNGYSNPNDLLHILGQRTPESDALWKKIAPAVDVLNHPEVSKLYGQLSDDQEADDIIRLINISRNGLGLGRDHYRDLMEMQGMDESSYLSNRGVNLLNSASTQVSPQNTERIRQLEESGVLPAGSTNRYQRLPQYAKLVNTHREAITPLYDFKQNPIMFLLRALLHDPMALRRAIQSLSRVYNPANATDMDFANTMNALFPDIQDYADYLPWLKLLSNARTAVTGDGEFYN